MHWLTTTATLLTLPFFGLSTPLSQGPCALTNEPEIIIEKSHELHQVWTIEETHELSSSPTHLAPSLADFLAEVRRRVSDVRPEAILSRQHQDFLNSGDPRYAPEAENPRIAYSREAGRIRPIHCIESLLLGVQAARQSMIDEPSEFGAYFLRKNINGVPQLRIYYSTIDRMGTRGLPDEVSVRIETDLTSGWVLRTHLHNHPFDFHNPVNSLGGTSPSLSDVHAYQSQVSNPWNLPSARITNGFDTIEMEQAEFFVFLGQQDD